jgi:hypothetical protein
VAHGNGPPRLRRPAASVLAVALLATAALSPARAGASVASSARRAGVRWAGHTAQGHRIVLRTVRREGVRHLVEVVATFDLICSGTGEALTFTYGSGPVDVPAVGGAVALDDVLFNTAFHLAGRLRTLRGGGTVSLALAAFTPDEELQRCESGPVAWKAHRRPARSSPRPAADSSDASMRIDRGPAGPVLSLTEGRPAAAEGTEPVAVYFGETGQDIGIFFEILGGPGSRRLGTYDIGAIAGCPGSPVAIGVQILGFADLPLSHRSWRIDEVGLFSAMHWDGTVATSPARGTLSMAFPAFSLQEDLVTCDSGPVRWRATRIDPSPGRARVPGLIARIHPTPAGS